MPKRLDKNLQQIEEKHVPVDSVSKMSAANAESVPSHCKKKATLVDKSKKVWMNYLAKENPGKMMPTQKDPEEEINVLSKCHLKDETRARE